MADRNSPVFSYPLPVLVRVLSNPLKTKQNLPDYNKYICKGSEEPNPNYKKQSTEILSPEYTIIPPA